MKQWVSQVADSSDGYEQNFWIAERLVGAYPKYLEYEIQVYEQAVTGDNESEFLELEFETPVYLAAVGVYETIHGGGIKQISVKDREGQWQSVYDAAEISDLQQSRYFLPRVSRPNFKSKYIRIDLDHSVCKLSRVIDAVALYGYNHFVAEKIEPEALLARELPMEFSETPIDSEQVADTNQQRDFILSLTVRISALANKIPSVIKKNK